MRHKSYIKIFILFLLLPLVACVKQEIIEVQLAKESYDEGKYLSVIDYTKTVLAIDPFNYDARLLSGKANYQIENYPEAEKEFTTILRSTNMFEPYYLRGKTYFELEQFELAIRDFNSALKLSPENKDVLFNIAYTSELLENFQESINAYKEILKIDSMDSKVYVNLGNVMGSLDDHNSAITYFSKAIEITPNDAVPYFNRGNEKIMIGELTGAIEDIEKSLQYDSENIDALFLLAELSFKTDDNLKALSACNNILDLGENSNALLIRGVIYLRLEDTEKACSDFARAGDLGNFNAYELINNHCKSKKKKKKK